MSDAPDIETESGEPAGDVPAVSPDRLDGSGHVGGNRSRGLPFSLAGSVLFHVAVAAFLLLSPTGRSIATKLAGLKADGTSSYGSSSKESPTGSIGGNNPNAISVTLTPPPAPRQPKPKPKPKPHSKPIKPVQAASKPSAPPIAVPQKAPPEPIHPESILAAKASGPDAAEPQAEKPPKDEKPARQPAQAEAQPEAAAAEPVPVPAPRPPRLAMAQPQAANEAPAGTLFGTLGGHHTAPASGAKNGGKKHGEGNAAVSKYPGTIASKLNASLRYPAAARSKGLSGETRVKFVVEASGKVGAVRVLTSSGSGVLDEAAIAAVKRAAPFPPIPAAANRKLWPFSASLAFGE